ncbi:potassium channel family protein [Piscinibacter gummiphilus]|uniref:Ion channel n=1 Tax=Piscinibacter gummiphilus TaxID=946333 RepID=A0ABZ0CVP0_9BURK|nr:ion channel [Piscinibacter gummiphilus]WOB09039.1 ion channel [Piscinibacter gummiphilus]
MDRPLARPSPLSAWRRLEVAALAATVPAFYMALLSVHGALVAALYLGAALCCAVVLWRERPARTQAMATRTVKAHRTLGVALVVGLVLSGALPQGDGVAVLGVRLFTAALIVGRWGESMRLWFWRGSLPYLLVLAIAVLGLCGLGFWWLDPHVRSFGDGLWLAFTTAATVGYGDMVPSTPAAKIFAVFVVLMGFGVLSLVTASIAAMWVHTEERRIEHEILHDLHRQVRSLHEEIAALRRDLLAGPGVKGPVGATEGPGDRRTPGAPPPRS